MEKGNLNVIIFQDDDPPSKDHREPRSTNPSKEEAKEQPKKEVGEYKRPAMKNTEAFGLTGPIPTGKNHGKSDPDELRMQAMSNNQPNRNRFGKQWNL